MAQYTQWIIYKDRKILSCNFKGLKEKEYLEAVEEMEKILLAQAAGSKPLLMIDATDSAMTIATKARGDEVIKKLIVAGIHAPTAMLGIKGLKKIIASALSRDVYFADNPDAACKWLINQ